MRIAGIQKLTLLDYPGHIAATIFTPGCDLRCPFCHNSELVYDSSNLEYYPEEVLEFLKQRVGKLDGVAITGGEPLMQKDIASFIKEVRAIGLKIKLDTNGTYPDRLKDLLDEGLLDYIAMDIKNAPSKWAKTAGLDEAAAKPLFEKTIKSMDMIKNSGVEYEFRTTIVKQLHDPADMEELAGFIGDVPKYFLQNFTDSGAILEEGFSAWDKATLLSMLDTVKQHIPSAALRGVD